MNRFFQFLAILFLISGALFAHHCEHHDDPNHHHTAQCLISHSLAEKFSAATIFTSQVFVLLGSSFLFALVFHTKQNGQLVHHYQFSLSRAPPYFW